MQTYCKRYLQTFQPAHAYWNYEDGCVLTGCIRLFAATEEPLYRRFVLDYLNARVSPDGAIPSFDTASYNIDSINCGKALFFALDETGEARYRKAIEFIMDRLLAHPRCTCGSFWHKNIYPNQIWLDGLYMAQPFYLEYERRFGGFERLPDIVTQFENVRRFLFEPEKGLFYHGFDETRTQPWCDPVTGCSHNFWLRSMGWYLMALADCAEILGNEQKPAGQRLRAMLREAAEGLLRYRDAETGLYYQVIDRADVSGNYLETSGSAMAACAMMKGARTSALPAEPFAAAGRATFDGLIRHKLRSVDGTQHLTGICAVAGLGPGNRRDGSVSYYLSEPVVSDEAKGVGAMIMAYAETLLQD